MVLVIALVPVINSGGVLDSSGAFNGRGVLRMQAAHMTHSNMKPDEYIYLLQVYNYLA